MSVVRAQGELEQAARDLVAAPSFDVAYERRMLLRAVLKLDREREREGRPWWCRRPRRYSAR